MNTPYEDEDTQDHAYTVPDDMDQQRLDKVLSELCGDLSRARLQSLIKDGEVYLNGAVQKKASIKIDAGDTITFTMPDPVEAEPKAENIPLDIVYEDKDLLVINKPAGLVVHPGAGNWTGTLVNALLYHCRDDLSGIGGVVRPGIVHRLDKDTSGLMVVAKNDFAHQGLSDQLQDHTLGRVYHAICNGAPMPPKGTIDKPIGRHLHNRLKMAVTEKNAREAVTYYNVLDTVGEYFSLVECRLKTGRTHQIRVHLAHNGYPLLGDPLYGAQATAVKSYLQKAEIAPEVAAFPRQALHAKVLSFIHPRTEEEMIFVSEYPEDIANLLQTMGFSGAA